MESSIPTGTFTRAQLDVLVAAVERPDDEVLRHFDSLPLLLDRYELREPIGLGGMGAVFKAWDCRLRAHVAVKVARSGSTARNATRLLKEARSAAAIHHEHVVGIRDVGEAEDGTPFVVMDFLDGQPLADVLRERGRLPLQEAFPILEQVAAGLQAAHESGIVHRDLKPSNVFVLEREWGVRCTLIDFGLARVFDVEDDEARSLTKDGYLVGTPRYMSPEQISGNAPVGPATDIYAWGCLAHHVLTGSPPFGGTLHQLLHKHLHETPPPLEGVPSALAAFVRRCLSKEPRRRPESALDLQTAVTRSVVVGDTTPARVGPLLGAIAACGLVGALGWTAGRAGPHAQTLTASLTTLRVGQVAVAMPSVVAEQQVETPEPEPEPEPKPPPEPVAEEPRADNDTKDRPRRRAQSRPRRTPEPPAAEQTPEPTAGSTPRSREDILRELDGLD
jgi:predicted Ser/Thr protein kinase